MVEDYQTEDGRLPFKDWLASPTDRQALQDGVWELRIDHDPGYRVYYARTGKKLLLLLIGGDKNKQQSDINKAMCKGVRANY